MGYTYTVRSGAFMLDSASGLRCRGRMPIRPKIMISYASEDRDFARSLRDGLAQSCDVWFDEDKINVGDSLFEQINRGLGSADFAVVVLSPNYLAKKWTNNELAGFMTLEEKTRKMILPVWKDITREQVAKFSAILADRNAAKAADGIPAVVARLRGAIEAASLAVELATRPAAADRLAAFGRARHTQAQVEAKLATTEGVREVKAAFEAMIEKLETTLVRAQSDGLKFLIKRGADGLTAHTRYRLSLSVTFQPMFVNSIRESPLRIRVILRGDEWDRRVQPSIVEERELNGWFENDTVVWCEDGHNVFPPEQVIELALDLLLKSLQRESGA